jgi:hypothetical protein
MYSNKGYQLAVVETPLWAYLAEKLGEWLCKRTGNLLCSAGLPGWAWNIGFGKRGEDGDFRWNLGSALFSFGQWFHGISGRRERELYSMPLSVDEVAEYFPSRRIEFLEEDA